jgi:S-adenosylmethionine:tRNA ribosyltransferase-isomerase
MDIGQFDFDLPAELIAQRPAQPRDAARMLVIDARLRDARVKDLPDVLLPGDLLVVNDTRVIRAQLFGHRRDAKVSVTLHQRMSANAWSTFAKPARRLREGDRVDFPSALSATVVGKGTGGEVVLAFDRSGAALDRAIAQVGAMPLPPYIKREHGPDRRDEDDYQTMFARREGAVAAPTAGLHFTPTLLMRLKSRGVGLATVTLHVGAGTFLPVKADDVRDHRMHVEHGTVSAEAAARINAAHTAGGRIIAVGTTSLRILETAYDPEAGVQAFSGATDLFILPGDPVRSVDLLLTNFHLPRSTLFMLVCAFAGTERMQAAYRHAIAERYRFFSYGDCCLLHRERA